VLSILISICLKVFLRILFGRSYAASSDVKGVISCTLMFLDLWRLGYADDIDMNDKIGSS